MRLAKPSDLGAVAGVLERLRSLDELSERREGVFTRGSATFLHFHVDPSGMFADLKTGRGRRRYPVSRAADQRRFVADVRGVLNGQTTGLRGTAR